jgi:V/A-type H+-transporting ATPase subunit A
MGYGISLMADSTSRWAEAMREISSRLEEMPGEEGYPAYLATKLAAFYERSGRVTTLNKKEGSITVIGAVSPPGADFSEPITQNTLRMVKVFWALDTNLAHRRHFPAINWLTSYSFYMNTLEKWFEDQVSTEWKELRVKAMEILQKEAELQEIVQLIGSDALPEKEQITLEFARALREIFLQQHAGHEVDSYCTIEKQYKLLKAIMEYGNAAYKALDAGTLVGDILKMKSRDMLANSKFEKDFDKYLKKALTEMKKEFQTMGVEAFSW